MTDERQQRTEIEAGEAWLRSIDVGVGGPDLDIVKRRIRVAVDEAWIDPQLGAGPSIDVADGVKRRLREVLAERRSDGPDRRIDDGPSRRSWRPAGWLAGLSAAAVVAFCIVGLDARTAIEMPTADAFEQYEIDDFDTALGTLDDELQEFEVVFSDWSGSGDEDWLASESIDGVS